MIQVLNEARSYYDYMKTYPKLDDPYYESDLSEAEKRMYQIENAFLLDLDAVVPALCYYVRMLYCKQMVIQQAQFKIQDKSYTFLYFVEQGDSMSFDNSIVLSRCSNIFRPDVALEDMFSYLTNGLSIIGISIYEANSKPKYFCMAEHADNFPESEFSRAILMNSDKKIRAFILKIIQGNLHIRGNFHEEDGRFLDVSLVRELLPDYYSKTMIQMPEV